MERIVYTSISDGGPSLGAVSDDLADDVRAAVDEAHEAILSGDLVVPLVIEPNRVATIDGGSRTLDG